MPTPKQAPSTGQPQDLKTYAKQATLRGVETLLLSIGVPPDLAKRIAPHVLKVVSVLLAFVLILSVALFATELDGEDVETTAQYEQIDPQIRALVEEISEQETIPTRIVVAIALLQTRLGTSSPYEAAPRTPGAPGVASFPVVTPSIGTTKVRGEGLGMYLFRKDAVQEAGINPQSWREATELIVKLMADARDDLIQGGLPEPVTADEADRFWAKVVAELPLVDPLTGQAGCVGDPSDIGNAIITVWQCEARRSGARLYQVTPTLGVVRTSTLPSRESTAQLVQEALGVAWAWSSRNGATTWGDLPGLPCSNTAARAGVFPLTKDLAKKYGLTDRCDVIGNIRAAAQAVLDDLDAPVTPDANRPYAPMLQGWLALGEYVTGPGGATETFAANGPWRAYQPSAECAMLVATWTVQLPSSALADKFAAVGTGGRNAALEAFDAEIGGAPRRDPRCVDPATGKTAPLPVFLSYTAAAGVSALTEITEGSSGLSGSLSPAIDGLISLAALDAISSKVTTAAWGSTGVVERLSNQHITVEWPFVQPSSAAALPAGLAQRVIGTSIELGGLVGGDGRAGENPYASYLGDVFGSTGGIGISIDRQSPNAKPVVVDVSQLTPLVCGTAGVPRYGLAVLAQRWETMCQAAKRDGVDLTIISAWRSMADQTRLYNAYKGTNARVAKPGTSPHQKAQAVDVYLGSPDGAARNSGRAYAWLHSVVGCFDTQTRSYAPLSTPLLNTEYADRSMGSGTPCGEQLPIKRMQTFGLVPLCAAQSVTRYESLGSPAVVICDASTVITGSPSRQIREPWHLDAGEIVATAVAPSGTSDVCSDAPILNPQEPRNIAIAIQELWLCELSRNGFASMPPRDGPGGYNARKWFGNYAEQVAAEAVLVGFCESGLNPAASNGKYKGVFQMGPAELKSQGADPRLWADAKVNITAAAKLWISAYSRPNTLEGWSPWAVVNTSWYKPEGNSTQFPVIGRFAAQPPSPQAGAVSGQPLPNWAIDPGEYWAPVGICGKTLGMGKPMDDARPDPYRR